MIRKLLTSLIAVLLIAVPLPAYAQTSTGFDQSTGPDWVASFRANNQSFCSGQLISPNYVLTAAHCISPIQQYVGYGITIQFGPNADLATRSITELYIPESGSEGITQDNIDIMLVKLSAPITDIEPATVNSVNYSRNSSTSVISYGWSPRTYLNIVQGTITSQTQWSFNSDEEKQIGYLIQSSSSNDLYAKGDSGGPIINTSGELIGTLSGISTTTDSSSSNQAIFVPTTYYYQWINAALSASSVDASYLINGNNELVDAKTGAVISNSGSSSSSYSSGSSLGAVLSS